jgi:hypothetical protein
VRMGLEGNERRGMDNGYWKCGLLRIDMYMKEGRREIVIDNWKFRGKARKSFWGTRSLFIQPQCSICLLEVVYYRHIFVLKQWLGFCETQLLCLQVF